MTRSDTPPLVSIADERFASTDGRRQFWSATVSSWLGTTMEYVDFALYGLATALVFNRLFFPDQSPAVALLAGFSAYAVGFVARPLGALYFGRLGDRLGRKPVIVRTIVLMGGATTCIGLLPTAQQVGVLAPVLLVLLRLLQGFGAGAELSGAAVILGEYAPARRRGLLASVVALGSNSGTLLASLIWLLVQLLPEAQLLAWGWRIPFVGSALIAAAAFLIRLGMAETPVFERERTERPVEPAPPVTPGPARSRSKAFLLMIGLRIGENGPSYLAQSFLVGYVTSVLMLDGRVGTVAVLIASVLGFAVIPLAGAASDRFGRRVTYRAFCIALVIVAFPLFALLQTRNPAVVVPAIVVAVCLASLGIFGVQAAYGVELFGARHRFRQMALAKELGGFVSGGLAPAVAAGLLAVTGTWWPLALYWTVMAGIGLVTTFFAPETRGRDLNLPEDATETSIPA